MSNDYDNNVLWKRWVNRCNEIDAKNEGEKYDDSFGLFTYHHRQLSRSVVLFFR